MKPFEVIDCEHHRADLDALKEAAAERDAVIAADDVRWS